VLGDVSVTTYVISKSWRRSSDKHRGFWKAVAGWTVVPNFTSTNRSGSHSTGDDISLDGRNGFSEFQEGNTRITVLVHSSHNGKKFGFLRLMANSF
jgi:hypothetical protein